MISISKIQNILSHNAIESHIETEYGGSVDSFLDDIDAGLNRLIRTDLKDAEDYVDIVQHLSGRLLPKYKGRIVSLSARLALWTGKYHRAEKKYQSALKLFLKYRNYEAAARLRKGLVDNLMYLGKYDAAVKTGREALRFFRRKCMKIDAAQTMTNIGNVYHRMDNNTLALEYYDKAREIFADTGGVALAIVDYNRANVYANLNQLENAMSLYGAAATHYGQAGMELAENQAEYSIAYLQFLQDKYTDALTRLEKVHEAFSELSDVKSATIALLDIVEINVHLNQYGYAIMLGETIVPRFRALSMRYEEGKANYFLALARLELGDLTKVSGQLRKAETLFRKEDNDLWLGMVKFARNRLLQAQGKYRMAVEASAEAERYFQQSRDFRRKTDARMAQLEAMCRAGMHDEAARIAAGLKTRQLAGYQRYNLHTILGDYLYKEQVYGKALAHFKSAVEIVEQLLGGLYNDEIRFFFAADKYHSYQMVVECLLKLNQTGDAFVTNLSGLSLMNRPSLPVTELNREIPAGLMERIESLRTTLKRLHSYPREGERATARVSAYLSTEQELWHSIRKARSFRYGGESGDYDRRSVPEPSPVLQSSDEAIINYYVSENLVGAFVGLPGNTKFVKFELTPDELQVMIRKLHFVLERGVSNRTGNGHDSKLAEHYLAEIYEAVFEPLVPLLECGKIAIISDSFLSQIPFVALCDREGNYVVDRYKIDLVTDPQSLGEHDSRSVPRFASSKNAIFSVETETLPLVKQESLAIKSVFRRSRVFAGGRATRSNLLEALADANGFVHLAAHSSRSSENPLFSRILMDDGPFFPFDLFGTGINCTLITLSGCQTAAPGLFYGNSFSLARAFHQAGSRFVLASLWPVADRVAKHFMEEFYSRLKSSDNLSDSYRCAVNRIRERTDNPALWGSFVLLGR